MNPALQEAISHFDGKHTKALKPVREQLEPSLGLLTELIDLAFHDDSRVQQAATWLIKDYLEHGTLLAAVQTKQLLSNLDELNDWQSQLHILQCLPFLSIPQDCLCQLEFFLGKSFKSGNKFVRAWATNGWVELARQHQGYLVQAQAYVAQAQNDPAASVKARARKVSQILEALKSRI